ncbi:MAG: hypothetical protein M0Z73_00725 [Betaproteobacteria bacterium]|nr:hypothetical protein [Betaproteobacteria bacterium]
MTASRCTGGQVRPVHAAHGVEDQLPVRRPRIASGHVGRGARRAKALGSPRGRSRGVGVVASDDRVDLGRIEKHDRGLPGRAGQQLASDVDQPKRPPGVQRLHPVPTESAQIARDEAGEFERLTRQRGHHQMGKQQVAEIVAVERTEQHGRGTHGRHGFSTSPRIRVRLRSALQSRKNPPRYVTAS